MCMCVNVWQNPQMFTVQRTRFALPRDLVVNDERCFNLKQSFNAETPLLHLIHA